MDLLNTRNKENKFLDTCFLTQSRFVVDNTNPTIEERKKYIALAKENKYEVIAYYFESSIESAIERNNLRTGKEKIPEIGIRGCYKKLEPPAKSEGFDKIYRVTASNNEFIIEECKDEI
ncbi:hypothetical protein AUTU_30850 [Aureibacter tunicatorum]|nr:hypothetical protein AUTU_30850 [Aureibacter tunicatorum]